MAEKPWLDQSAHAPIQGPENDGEKQYQLLEKIPAFHETSETRGDVH